MQLEEVALADDYFVSRKLYPNVDFYTGLIYKAMGFPTKMFTVLFALGRLPGWIAQWREMIEDPQTKIGRPRQVYTGATERDYVPMDAPLSSDASSRHPAAGWSPSSVITTAPVRRDGDGTCGLPGCRRRATSSRERPRLVHSAMPTCTWWRRVPRPWPRHTHRRSRPPRRSRGRLVTVSPLTLALTPSSLSSSAAARAAGSPVAGAGSSRRQPSPSGECAAEGRGEQPALLLVVGVRLGVGAASAPPARPR